MNAYDGLKVAELEDLREAERQARLAEYEDRYVSGPILSMGFRRMNVSFNPGTVEVLPGHGQIYPGLRLTDEWGVLEASGGAMIRRGWKGVVVPAPPEGRTGRIEGDGYVLELADGWRLVEDPETGGLTVRKDG